RLPGDLHPAFFGSWDWHSSVHQHWLLARLLRLGRAGSQADAARAALVDHLTAPKLAVETAYLRERPSFERTYGWAWLLKLADELAGWTDADASTWREALGPAVDAVRESWMAHLPLATYPIRAGTHANSTFGMLLALEHARATADEPFGAALEERARAWFAGDRDHPAHLEPGGDDFLSPALVEAALMAAVLGPAGFADWLTRFLPGMVDRHPGTLFEPAVVADRSDPKMVHLDGLNLSRAWSWRRLAAALGSDPRGEVARAAAERHLDAALPHVFSGQFAGQHWVGSFALMALND
ncbi:MAG: DUF2891 domain-containing protein, partial [Candidatus Limnocylindria bacterium]